MKVVVGLGNPGPEYAGTRHNAGFDVVQQVAATLGVSLVQAPGPSLVAQLHRRGHDVHLVCPLAFMNRSGAVLRRLDPLGSWDARDLLVVYDDVDLDPGRVLMRERGSDGGHRGLRSVVEALGTELVPRLRIGVGRGVGDTVDHVLGRPGAEEAAELQKAVAEAAQAVVTWLDSASTQIAMNRVNRRPRPDGDPPAASDGA